jgi:hypothetical protein
MVFLPEAICNQARGRLFGARYKQRCAPDLIVGRAYGHEKLKEMRWPNSILCKRKPLGDFSASRTFGLGGCSLLILIS